MPLHGIAADVTKYGKSHGLYPTGRGFSALTSTKLELGVKLSCNLCFRIEKKVEYYLKQQRKEDIIMPFLHCALYLAATGVAGFLLGRILPKSWFRGDAFPYHCRPWEQKLWRALHIKEWQSRVPDMSRLLPALMPAKKLTAETFSDLPRMIQETCVAELIHMLLSLSGLCCLVIWPGAGGVILTAVYILLGNLPFILIQRYNRPRLQRLYALQQRRQERKVEHAHTDPQLQYGRGA